MARNHKVVATNFSKWLLEKINSDEIQPAIIAENDTWLDAYGNIMSHTEMYNWFEEEIGVE